MDSKIKQSAPPACVAVIMDGNRRWAKAQGLPTFAGHQKGRETLKSFLTFAKRAGVQHVIAFAFSSENWKRSSDEVSFLMSLMLSAFREDREEFIKEKVRIYFAGDLSKFPQDLRDAMSALENDTAQYEHMSLTLCVSYGGREEIIQATQKCIADKLIDVTEKDISDRLYTARVPDPDIIIRTSGEMRLSGFLLWQSAYSELFFTDTLWPDFGEEEFLKILQSYSLRERRLGK